MEEVLKIYHRPYDPDYPVICMDESTKQCVKSSCDSIPLSPGYGVRQDYEYERNGVGHLFMFFEPMIGFRHVDVKTAHCHIDWANSIATLMDTKYASAKKVTFVMDNLATHKAKFFYEIFSAEKARALLDRMEFVYTPKHASWLNMAEIALSVLQKECLDRRISNIEDLRKEVQAWELSKNQVGKKVDWRFTAADARIKLKKFYPSI